MGISQIGVSTIAPKSATMPIFTYNNGYTHANGNSQANGVGSAIYNINTKKIMWVLDSSASAGLTSYFMFFDTTNNTFSTNTAVPTAANDYDLCYTSDGRIWYCPQVQAGVSKTLYYSTNDGSTWTTYSGFTNINVLFPISSTIKTLTNNSDVVGAGFFNGAGTGWVLNHTAGTNYAIQQLNDGAVINNTSNTVLWRTLNPIRKGNDVTSWTNGYLDISGANNNTPGTRNLSNIHADNKRSTFSVTSTFEFPVPHSDTSNTTTYSRQINYYPPAFAGNSTVGTCIEERWFIFRGGGGFYLYDLQSGKHVGSILQEAGRGAYCTTPIYVSSTKKLYVHNDTSTKTMHVYDVSFE